MKPWLIAFVWLSSACQLVPVGPSLLPGRRPGESLAAFRTEDRACRVDAERDLVDATGDLQARYDGDYRGCMASAPLRATSTFFPPPPLSLEQSVESPSFGPPATQLGEPLDTVPPPGAVTIEAPSGLM